jgi:hypothetical protein
MNPNGSPSSSVPSGTAVRTKPGTLLSMCRRKLSSCSAVGTLSGSSFFMPLTLEVERSAKFLASRGLRQRCAARTRSFADAIGVHDAVDVAVAGRICVLTHAAGVAAHRARLFRWKCSLTRSRARLLPPKSFRLRVWPGAALLIARRIPADDWVCAFCCVRRIADCRCLRCRQARIRATYASADALWL